MRCPAPRTLPSNALNALSFPLYRGGSSKNTPTNPNYACNASDPLNTCELGDLSGKFGVLLPDASGRVKGVVHDATIGILSGYRITGLSVVVHNGSPRIACANLVQAAAVARFNTAGVSGTITLTKASGGRYGHGR